MVALLVFMTGMDCITGSAVGVFKSLGKAFHAQRSILQRDSKEPQECGLKGLGEYDIYLSIIVNPR